MNDEGETAVLVTMSSSFYFISYLRYDLMTALFSYTCMYISLTLIICDVNLG